MIKKNLSSQSSQLSEVSSGTSFSNYSELVKKIRELQTIKNQKRECRMVIEDLVTNEMGLSKHPPQVEIIKANSLSNYISSKSDPNSSNEPSSSTFDDQNEILLSSYKKLKTFVRQKSASREAKQLLDILTSWNPKSTQAEASPNELQGVLTI